MDTGDADVGPDADTDAGTPDADTGGQPDVDTPDVPAPDTGGGDTGGTDTDGGEADAGDGGGGDDGCCSVASTPERTRTSILLALGVIGSVLLRRRRLGLMGTPYLDDGPPPDDGIREPIQWSKLAQPRFMTATLIVVLVFVFLSARNPESKARGAGVEAGQHVLSRAYELVQAD